MDYTNKKLKRMLIDDEKEIKILRKQFEKQVSNKKESRFFQPFEVYKDYQPGKPFGKPYEFHQKQSKKIVRSNLA